MLRDSRRARKMGFEPADDESVECAGSALSVPRLRLLEHAVSRALRAEERAVRTEGRAAFDRFFDVWFDRFYAISCQLAAGDEMLARQITTRLLVRAVRSVLI